MKKLLTILFLSSILSITSCSDGTNSTGSNSVTPAIPQASVDDIANIPSIDGQPTISHLFVHNYGNTEATGLTFKLVSSIPNAFTLDTSTCKSIPANGSCTLALTATIKKNQPLTGVINTFYNNQLIDTQSFLGLFEDKMSSINRKHKLSDTNSGFNIHVLPSSSIIDSAWYTTAIVYVTDPQLQNLKNLVININNQLAQVNQIYCPNSTLSYGQTCSVEVVIKPNVFKNKTLNAQKFKDDLSVQFTPVGSLNETMVQGNSANTVFLPTGSSSINTPDNIASDTFGQDIIIPVVNIDMFPVNGLNLSLNTSDFTVSTNSTCKDTLESYTTCEYILTPNPNILHNHTAQATINFNQTSEIIAHKIVNFSYIGSTVTPQINVSIDGDSSFITDVGIPITKLITLTNTTVNPLNNLNIILPQNINGFSIMTDSCIGTNLIENVPCMFQLQYLPTSMMNQTDGIITFTGTYIDSNNVPQQYSSNYSIQATANQSNAALQITPLSGNSFNIIANNSESITQTFSLTNTGNYQATGINFSSITLPAHFVINSNTCSTTLNANTACQFTLRYGPTNTVVASTNVNINLDYIANSSGTTANATFGIEYSATQADAALIQIIQITPSVNITGGNGDSTAFEIINNLVGTIDIKYENMAVPADASANNLQVDLSTLGAYTLISNSCSNTLAPYAVCDIIISPNTSTVGVNNFMLPHFSYSDIANPSGISITPLTPLGNNRILLNVVAIPPVF